MSTLDKKSIIGKKFNYNGDQIRSFQINKSIWFYGKDIANVLGFKNTRQCLKSNVDNDDKKKLTYQGVQNMDRRYLQALWHGIDRTPRILINESGVYALIFNSRLPSARKFKHWVTHDVLPSIRKTGSYHKPMSLTDRLLQRDKEEIALLQNNKQQQKQIQKMTPDAKLGHAVTVAKTNIGVGSFAKILHHNGVNMGRNQLFQWLRSNHYLISYGYEHNIPRQKFINEQLFTVQEYRYRTAIGIIKLNLTTKITPKGQKYFVNKLVK